MHKLTDLIIAVLATVGAFALSWPFFRRFAYWAESSTAWWIYFVLGFVLAVYVFYAFFGSMHLLFQHAVDEQRAAEEETGTPEEDAS